MMNRQKVARIVIIAKRHPDLVGGEVGDPQSLEGEFNPKGSAGNGKGMSAAQPGRRDFLKFFDKGAIVLPPCARRPSFFEGVSDLRQTARPIGWTLRKERFTTHNRREVHRCGHVVLPRRELNRGQRSTVKVDVFQAGIGFFPDSGFGGKLGVARTIRVGKLDHSDISQHHHIATYMGFDIGHGGLNSFGGTTHTWGKIELVEIKADDDLAGSLGFETGEGLVTQHFIGGPVAPHDGFQQRLIGGNGLILEGQLLLCHILKILEKGTCNNETPFST